MSDQLSKRKRPRFTVFITGFYEENAQWEECHVFDINLEGIGLGIHNADQMKGIIKIKIVSNSNEQVFRGQIVYRHHKRIGIKFIKNTEEQASFISQIINTNSNRFKIN